ncbi:unnamed protein product [Musa acuminata subsp. malaccensis]|uniref:(wild Malaysian banana) hypothetical protein n=1 Tax=Musa acuminata subsp. malaccensis TaxID=214687 RepID=A0A804IDV0_MUSAM|nr:PREDICTED: blue copper protein-like [Musa acuminata subsp. malaccensis]CAG1850651.1 unnamed protein product [Musa acuminata subsp. malaccensis]
MEGKQSWEAAPRRVSGCSFRCLLIICCLVTLLSCQGTVAYKNYTVGDSLGWFDSLMKPAVDYQKWAAGKSFGLGDFLFFDTDKNHSVVQTYNATTYEQCNYDDAEADDTTEWSATAPQYSSDPVTVPVPLLKVGTTYFFSGNYDGEQCQHGQHFKINVTYGQGLPESLRSPSEASAPASPEDGGADTSVPANFDHPKDTDDEVKPSSRAGETVRGGRLHVGFAFLCVLMLVR